MFRILELTLHNHSVLKDLSLKFMNNEGDKEGPYTSVIIGPNGSGKSYILRELINIFREIEQALKGKKTKYSDGYFLIDYIFDKIQYTVTNGKFYFLFIVDNVELSPNVKLYDLNGDYNGLKIPSNIIASSIMLNDRFPFFNSSKTSFYQYLGIRRTAGTTSTHTPIRKTINAVIENLSNRSFNDDINALTKFLEFEKGISFNYKPRYFDSFFTGNINPVKFHSAFQKRVEESKNGYTRWGASHYLKIKDDSYLIDRICNYLNSLSLNNVVYQKPRLKLIRFDPATDENFIKNYDLIEHLFQLNIIESPSITVNKENNNFEIENASSGELHFLLSFLSIFAKIKDDSIILIDEPEISLHPNWQMQYIDFLKRLFKKFKSCHFIIATHSHFLISDLNGVTSSTIRIKKENNNVSAVLIYADTYAWSAEDILYSVFKVKTTRNYFIEKDLRELLSKISSESSDLSGMQLLINRLNSLALKEDDPVKEIIKKANDYVNDKTNN